MQARTKTLSTIASSSQHSEGAEESITQIQKTLNLQEINFRKSIKNKATKHTKHQEAPNG
jgi:hypothetical protein